MIRPFTLMTMLLAAAAGAYLFAVKHRAQALDDEMAKIDRAMQVDDQRIAFLKEAWTQATTPSRLQPLAQQFAPDLRPMAPGQLVPLAALPDLLPPPDAAPPAGAPPAPQIAAAAPPASLPLPPPPPPAAPRILLAAATRPPVAAEPAVLRVAQKTHAHLAHTQWAENLAPPRPLAALPQGGQIAAAGTPPPPDNGGSLLGMAADLAPPEPLPSSTGN